MVLKAGYTPNVNDIIDITILNLYNAIKCKESGVYDWNLIFSEYTPNIWVETFSEESGDNSTVDTTNTTATYCSLTKSYDAFTKSATPISSDTTGYSTTYSGWKTIKTFDYSTDPKYVYDVETEITNLTAGSGYYKVELTYEDSSTYSNITRVDDGLEETIIDVNPYINKKVTNITISAVVMDSSATMYIGDINVYGITASDGDLITTQLMNLGTGIKTLLLVPLIEQSTGGGSITCYYSHDGSSWITFNPNETTALTDTTGNLYLKISLTGGVRLKGYAIMGLTNE